MKRRALPFSLLIALLLAAIALLVFRLLPGSEPEEIPVVLAQGTAAAAQQSGSAAAELPAVIAVTPETVQTAVETLERAENYSRVLSVERFWSGGESRETVSVKKRGADMRITIASADTETKDYLLTDGTLWVSYGGGSGLFRRSAAAEDTDLLQSIPTYEKLLNAAPDSILDAGYTEYNGEACIYACYIEGRLQYEYRCYVSPETGLLSGCEIYDADELIYRMLASETALSVPEDSWFAVPQE